ncbi:cutinase family protein [Rhodococcus jostii]|uniref:Cutinase family protein n=1 Tax=Rhodococcus jostii TaxID=132919 RepID=A0ABU4CQG5_RHOJO|nr:cutinase family protein [Rhodococcus jostii]MDV6285801.1 cutinase family protein [Rhodococcus jostii]
MFTKTVGALTSVIVFVASVWLLTPTSAAGATEFDCTKDIQIIGVPGSGDNPQRDGQLGSTVYSAVTELTATQGKAGRQVGWKAVNYAAEHVSVILTDNQRYFNGLDEGVRMTLSMLTDYALTTDCLTQRLVLVGYSQGAMVLHRVLRALQDPGFATIAKRIDGVVLIADGDKVAHDRVQNFGTAPANTHGIGVDFNFASGTLTSKLGTMWGTRVKHVCNKNDVVCGLYLLAPPIVAATGGIDVHNGYAGGEAVKKAVNSIKFNYPPDTPGLSPGALVQGVVGTTITSRLHATAGRNCKVSWALRTGSRLPEGLTLSPDGLVSGTASATWDKPVNVRMTAICPGRKSATADAKVGVLVTVPPDAPTAHTYGRQSQISLAGINTPNGLAVDSSGNLYVSDQFNRRVVRKSADGRTQTDVIIGLRNPVGLTVDQSQNVYVADSSTGKIMRYQSSSGAVDELPHPPLPPRDVATDGTGSVYALSDNAVMKLGSGQTQWELIRFDDLGEREGYAALLGLAVSHEGDIYVSNNAKGRVLVKSAGSTGQSVLPFPTLTTAEGLAIDSVGNLFVVDNGTNRVFRVDKGEAGATAVPFKNLQSPTAIAVGPSGDLYINSRSSNQVFKLSAK